MQTLDLTLDEVIHIRSVLTKAEMEGLPLDGTLKEDVERGKICFLCMKTRFGFWSGYGHKCQLCKQKICHKCSTKVSFWIFLNWEFQIIWGVNKSDIFHVPLPYLSHSFTESATVFPVVDVNSVGAVQHDSGFHIGAAINTRCRYKDRQ